MRSKCACGDVEVPILSKDHDSLICHCNMCRSRTGAAFTTWVTLKKEFVEVPEHQGSVTEYVVSKYCKSVFCGSCGTHVLFHDVRYPNIFAFTAGTLDGIEIKSPEAEYFYSDKAEWYNSNLETKKYGGLTGFEEISS